MTEIILWVSWQLSEKITNQIANVYFFSPLTTILPAVQASRIYPADVVAGPVEGGFPCIEGRPDVTAVPASKAGFP